MAESDPLRWFKYREKYAEGPGDWEYIWTCKALLEEKIWDLKQQAHWNEHYRGVEFEEIAYPPLEYLEGLKESILIEIAWQKSSYERITKLISKIKEKENVKES